MKKVLIAMMLILAMLLTLVACNSSDDESTTTTTAKAKTTTTTAKVENPSDDDDGDDEPIDLTDVYIPYGTASIDGVKEAAWDNAAKFDVEQTKKGSAAPDTKVTGYMMWDTDGLYFLFDIIDSDIAQNVAAGDYNNDGIYLYISENANNDITAFEAFADGTYQFALINDELSMIPRKGNVADELNAHVIYQTTATGMIIEFSYKSCQPTQPAAGQLMYMDIQYNDCSGTLRLGALGWYNGTDENSVPNRWGYITLLAEGAVAPEIDNGF